MFRWPVLVIIGLTIGGIVGISLTGGMHGENGFFKWAGLMQMNYTKNIEGYNKLGQQFEIDAPYGSNSLCLTSRCERAYAARDTVRGTAEDLAFQQEFYPAIIRSLRLPRGAFINVLPNGQVNTIPLSYIEDGLIVNGTLHYTGGEKTGLDDCPEAPEAGSSGSCKVDLSPQWLVRYVWMPESSWGAPGEVPINSDTTFDSYKAEWMRKNMPEEIECPKKPYDVYRACIIDKQKAIREFNRNRRPGDHPFP